MAVMRLGRRTHSHRDSTAGMFHTLFLCACRWRTCILTSPSTCGQVWHSRFLSLSCFRLGYLELCFCRNHGKGKPGDHHRQSQEPGICTAQLSAPSPLVVQRVLNHMRAKFRITPGTLLSRSPQGGHPRLAPVSCQPPKTANGRRVLVGPHAQMRATEALWAPDVAVTASGKDESKSRRGRQEAGGIMLGVARLSHWGPCGPSPTPALPPAETPACCRPIAGVGHTPRE